MPSQIASFCCGVFAQENGGDERWVVLISGFGDPDQTKCYASEDVEDPTEIPVLNWSCELTLVIASSCRLIFVRIP